jgi:hypothetical protein
VTPGLQAAPGSPVCPPDWLDLREPADHRARAEGAGSLLGTLADALRPPRGDALVVRDLGCGTGSLARWLAPRLPGNGPGQDWLLHDRDPALLERALAGLPAGVTGEAVPGDVTRLDAAALSGTDLVAASALLDLLTADEVERLAAACAAAGTVALLTLSVTGEVRFDPAEPLDVELAGAFDAHQRRDAAGGRLLGPDAAAVAAATLRAHGFRVHTAASPWRLGPASAPLLAEWLDGWLGAACAQRPELTRAAAAYAARRRRRLADGELTATVGHLDLLAVPPARLPGAGS